MNPTGDLEVVHPGHGSPDRHGAKGQDEAVQSYVDVRIYYLNLSTLSLRTLF